MYVIYVYIHIISTKTVCARPHSHVCTVDREPHQTNFTCFLLHSEHTAETHCTVSHWTLSATQAALSIQKHRPFSSFSFFQIN